MNGLDAPEKPVRASVTPNRSRSLPAAGSMAMMGQKNKRSQAAYPRRYPGNSAENQGSCSEHHGSGRSETAVVPTPKRAFQRETGLGRHGLQRVDFATWVEKEIGWKVQTIKGPRKWIRVREGEEPPPLPPEPAGFTILPRCWVVERSFAWMGKYRRLSKAYERSLHHSESMV